MRGLITAVLIACALALAAIALGGCGDSDSPNLIPSDQADALKADLDRLQQAVDGQDCDVAMTAADTAHTRVEGLPPTVDGDLVAAIDEGIEAAKQQADTQCKDPQANVPRTVDEPKDDTQDEPTETTSDEPATDTSDEPADEPTEPEQPVEPAQPVAPEPPPVTPQPPVAPPPVTPQPPAAPPPPPSDGTGGAGGVDSPSGGASPGG
jgi:hypothetical protein